MGEHQPASATAEGLTNQRATLAREKEVRAAMAWEEAPAKMREEATAKDGAGASALPAREANSPPLSPPREGRTNWAHDPARQAKADARTGGTNTGDAAGQDMANPHEPAIDQTATPEVPPATDQDEGAGQGSGQMAAGGET